MLRNPFLGFLFLILSFNFAFAEGQDLLGKDCKSVNFFEKSENSIDVFYRGKNNLQYGATASANAQNFNLIVFHWPGNCSGIDQAVSYGQNYDSSRQGIFGYHFYIDQEGKIIQAAPMYKRTNHVDSRNSRGVVDYNNNSAIGISLVCSEKGTGAKQLETAVKLGNAVQVAYGISSNRIFGHGQIQTTRDPAEGLPAANATKNNTPKGEYIINYTLENGSKAVCKIDGPVPAGCSGNLCNVSVPANQTSPAGTLGNLLNKINGNKKIYNDSNDPGDSFILDDKNYNLKNNPNYNNYNNNNSNTNPYLGNTQPNPYLKQIVPTTTRVTTNANCTNTYIVSERLKRNYYLNYYNKNYFSNFGMWDSFLKNKNSEFSFERMFAVFIAKKIESSVNNLKSCNFTE